MRIKNKLHLLILLVCLLTVLGVSAEEQVAQGVTVSEDKVSLNFVDADIESVIKAIGLISGKNFLIDPKVKGSINISTSKPVPKAMTYQILLSALRVQGFTAVESEGITAIVPEADAKTRFTANVSGGKQGVGQIATRVYVLKNESASQVVNIVKPLMSSNSVVTPYTGNNSLIITDYADNLLKISKLINTIDQPQPTEHKIVSLKYGSALELSQILNKLSADTNNSDPMKRLVTIPDPRTNSIILKADNTSLINRAYQLIEKLDVPTNGSGGSIHVVYLKNAEATKLASTLRSLMSGKGFASSTLATTGSQAETSTTQVQINQTQTASPADAAKAINNLENPARSVSATASPFSPLASSQENGMIQADASTNSLLIVAPDHIYNMLLAVIDKLDVRRAQLYIEALIAEVSTDKASEFGIQWQELEAFDTGTLNANNLQGFGGTNFTKAGGNILGVASNVGAAGKGLNVGLLKGKVNIPGIGTVANLGLLAHALESNANANILSKPNLLTLDNEEAKIVIGQNVPFVTGQYAQTGSSATVTPFQTIERQDVGLTLKVKPQISEGNTIKLQIHQEVSSVYDAALSAGITTNKRAIDTSVLVDDGSVIVLGGLIEDKVTDSVEKVPFLGDLPGIGTFFRSVNRGHKKTNLMVFLRPYVMRTPEDSGKIGNERYDYIIQEQLAAIPKSVWPLADDTPVVLPALETGKLKMEKTIIEHAVDK